ncbi:probable inactive leucine-rich repeat receptor kinase At3g03770 [Olea europaea subsp. europaea]|uniref:Probable inactive leucine-rich repeat receptor kinase At3g03770 n=1 Tax=Olea europaea subsp. europaea TaxID=158383 RepID=A0A8S0PGP0_OLEEU|nr:probable inactive leucine-rich repeat receptor kinase At3g03770 [Olea europaea subsp. europaea]
MSKQAPLFHLLFLLFSLLPHYSNQLQPSQYQALLRIKQLLNFPEEISSWSDNSDFCNTEPSQIITLSCYEDRITQLHVTGNNWFPHLLQDFSTVSLFSSLASFPDLKVLSLVSLGLKGPLPSEIGKLSSLEIMNVSSNYFDGIIPVEISFLKNLQTLILDYNRFTGQVPDWIGSFPALTVLSLKNNSFTGQLPNSLTSLGNLRTLVISANNLSGQVPVLDNLTNLQVLDFSDNNLGPQFPSLPSKLISLVLRKNKFYSAISDKLSSCYQLQKLDISLNELVGPFLPSLLSLPSLTYLDIADNKFTGKLSQNISCNTELVFVNLSENRLTGELPDCLHKNSKSRVVLFGGNCLSTRYQQQHPFQFCHNEALAVGISPQKQLEKRPYGKAVLASSMVGGIVGATAILGLAFLAFKRNFDKQQENEKFHTRQIVDKISPAYTLKLLKDARYISETIKLGALGIPPYRTFVLDELKEGTNNFDASNLIGEETHGQVYKGWLTDGTLVAIRSLKMKKRHSIQSYTHQLELISKLRHSHLVSAIGHCFECHKDDSTVSRIFLVFEYVPNGTLRKYISEGRSGQKFTWIQRINAAIEVARGIQFLHTGMVPGVYSNHLRITDILLSHDLHAKISKCNLPLLTENKRLDDVAVSSHGSKENCGSMLRYGEKNDVYDFGVILLEIIVGRMIVSEHDVGVSKDIVSFLSSTRLSIALNYYNHNLSLILKSLGSSTQSLFSF